jgi:hypothetical protein
VGNREWSGPDGQPANRPFHVVPLNDLREHPSDIMCPCLPVQVGGVIRHNSYDGREVGEVCLLALDLLGLALAQHNHTWTEREREAYDHAVLILKMHWDVKDG